MFSIHVCGPDEAMAQRARELEYEVFAEAFGNTPAQLDAEYGPYDPASRFVLAYDEERKRAAAMFRLILDSPAGLKTLNDIATVWGRPALTCDPERTGDIGSLVMRREYRGRHGYDVHLALYHALFAECRGLDQVISIIDLQALAAITRAIGPVMRRLEGFEPREYIGTPSQPVVIGVAEVAQLAHARVRERLIEGRGYATEIVFPVSAAR